VSNGQEAQRYKRNAKDLIQRIGPITRRSVYLDVMALFDLSKWWVRREMTARINLRTIVEDTTGGRARTVQHSIDDDEKLALLASETPTPKKRWIAQSSASLIRAPALKRWPCCHDGPRVRKSTYASAATREHQD